MQLTKVLLMSFWLREDDSSIARTQKAAGAGGNFAKPYRFTLTWIIRHATD